MSAKAIADGLFLVPAGAVNAYLIDAPEGLTMVDTGFPGKADKIFEAIKSIGRAPRDVQHIILTHAHYDHIGGLAAIVRATGARIYMHPLDAPIAERGSGFRPLSPAPGVLPRILMMLFGRANATVEPAKIDQHIVDGDVLPIGGGLQVIHVPGHCAGQVALLWRDRNALIVGDTATNLMGLGPPIGYEDRAEGERSQRKLAAMDFGIACFGHGKPLLRDAAAAFRKRWP